MRPINSLWIFICITALSCSIGCSAPKLPPPPADLQQLHLQGLNLISQHQFEDAEKVLLVLVEKSPRTFVPRFNLGVAQLNQAEKGVDRALITLKEAATIKPDQAAVHYCLGIIHRFLGDEIPALDQFRKALDLAPRDADCHYQVAIGLMRTGKNEEALPHFEMAVQIDPTIRGAWNNLQLAWRRAGQLEDAQRALEIFQELEASGHGRAHSSKYTEQGRLAEAIRDWSSPNATNEISESILSSELEKITGPREGGAPPFGLVDADLDCVPDLWIAGKDPGAWDLTAKPKKIAELPDLKNVVSFALGDVDEDGIVDIAISDGSEVRILRGNAGRTPSFKESISQFKTMATDLLLADIDMEGDLDLLLANGTGPVNLALNEGRTFRSLKDSPSLNSNLEIDQIIAVRDLDRDHDPDLLLNGETISWISGAPQWKFQENPQGRPLTSPEITNASNVLLVDITRDLNEELIFLQQGKLRVLNRLATVKNKSGEPIFGQEIEIDEKVSASSFSAIATADLNLDGCPELILSNNSETLILKYTAASLQLTSRSFPPASNLVVGDIDGDGDPDLIMEATDGSLSLLRNNHDLSSNKIHTFRAHLGGRRDGDDRRTNLLGFGARLEIRNPDQAVLAFQEGSRGHHCRGFLPVIVGTGSFDRVSSLVIDWPDGVLQAEIDVPTNQCQEIEEVQRKSSSCPVLFTFDGKKWNFITDFMGGGGLGAWIGPDEYAPPEPTEVVRIPPEALQVVDNRLRLSVMEPMQEICYADQINLIAVDHPESDSCYPEEFFPIKAPAPSGKPLLVKESERIFPSRIRDADGVIEVEKIIHLDRIYAEPRSPVPEWVGYCENQLWQFSFDQTPKDTRVALLLDGWVEYPYSRINFAAWQGSKRLSAPTFYWRRSTEEPWHLLGKEMGYPAGMPKTMVLDVSDIIAQGAREFRLDSNLELYWDRICLAAIREVPKTQIHNIPLHSAWLRDGGYPREYSDDGKLPATYHYDQRDPTLDYRQMEQGHVTRYGRVDELLTEVDDRFVIIGGGDELLLEYNASLLPELPDGWKRTWLLDTFGWCKDLDPLTGAREGVLPLPFRNMTQYPPLPDQAAPDRAEYQTQWNSRRD